MVVGMVLLLLLMLLPLVIRTVRTVQIVLAATGTGQELPPVSFELGATGKGGAFRRRRRIVVQPERRQTAGSTGGPRRNGRHLGLLRGVRLERVVEFS